MVATLNPEQTSPATPSVTDNGARTFGTIQAGMPVAQVMRTLLEAGVHFGHQTKRWNPKMRPYIFAERNGVHIIDLGQTVTGLNNAAAFVQELAAQGGKMLFVGTKKQAQDIIHEEANRCNQFFVNKRWPGGLLTNFVTIRQRLRYLSELEARQARGEFEQLPKKEVSNLTAEMTKLTEVLGGIKSMYDLPSAMFVVDPHKERIAMQEALRLEIPVVAISDTNSDPDEIDYVVPGNDDAIRSIKIITSFLADAYIEGAGRRAAMRQEQMMEEQEQRQRNEQRGGDRGGDRRNDRGGERGGGDRRNDRGGERGGGGERRDRGERGDRGGRGGERRDQQSAPTAAATPATAEPQQ